MIPVTLSKLDNYPGFVGSFDMIKWWKSQPLPGSVETINDVVWVYGQYHVCSAKMLDGTHSIYQTSDNGYSWHVVFNTTETINTIFTPDYGIALAATSGGWLRSINSGRTWSKITSSAPGCFCAKEIGNDYAVALSKRAVWGSSDKGAHWTALMTTSSDIIYPAIDGTPYDLLFGFGNTMYYSDNYGITWYDISGRMKAVFPSGTGAVGTITDIELTGIDGYYVNPGGAVYDDVPTFIVQFKLSSGLLRHYYLLRTPSADEVADSYYMFSGSAKFDALSAVKNSLCATYSRHTGSTDTDKLVVFTGTDTSYNPMIKYSIDEGVTWKTCALSTATVYSGPDLSQVSSGGNPFLEDVYFSASFSHGAYCHNYFYLIDNGHTCNQSFDMDFLLYMPATRDVSCSMDYLAERVHNKVFIADFLSRKTRDRGRMFDLLIRSGESYEYVMAMQLSKAFEKNLVTDVLIQKEFTKQYTSDILNRDTYIINMAINPIILKVCDAAADLDMISVLRFYIGQSMDMHLLKTVTKPLIMDIMYQDISETAYGMDITIEETIIYEILHHSERYNPQFPNIGLNYKRRPYPIFDSREETKV